jgi:ATP-dependent exoDNAse (exonuclease V) beta subunit
MSGSCCRPTDWLERQGRLSEHPTLSEGCGAPADAALEVSNEHTFSVVLTDDSGEEQLWSGSIDRLVLGRLGDDIVWAEVLDYKTDILTEEHLPDRVEYYRPQLETYGRVVAAQTGLPASEIRLGVVFLELGRVVEILPPSE